ncbi:MAG: nitroreductase family protein [Nitrospinota bacterium]
MEVEEAVLSRREVGRFRPGEEWGEPVDFTEAPVAIALALDPERAPRCVHGEKLHLVSGGCCLQNMLLTAHGLGLGANWVSHWAEEEVKVLLNIPRKWELAGMVALGYPAAGGAREEERLPLGELVSDGRHESPTRFRP